MLLLFGKKNFGTNTLKYLKGYSLANHTETSIYGVFEEDAARGEKFARAMSANTSAERYALHHLLKDVHGKTSAQP